MNDAPISSVDSLEYAGLWGKTTNSETRTHEISLDVLYQLTMQLITQNISMAEQNARIEDKIGYLAKKVDGSTNTSTLPFSESVIQSRTEGLSGHVQFFLKLLACWQLDEDDAYKLLGYELSESNYVKNILSGATPLIGRDIKDRLALLIIIRKRLDGLFKDLTVENEWLREKRAEIGNQSPMDLLLSGSMENLLLAKQFIEFVSGL